MAELELIFGWLMPLLIALFNVLVAGYALAVAGKDRSRVFFALGPAGVGAWALAWFISQFEVTSSGTTRAIGSLGGSLSMVGFALDAVYSVGKPRAVRLIAAAIGGGVALFAAGVYFVPRATIFDVLFFGARTLALSMSALVFVVQLQRARTPSETPELKKLARSMVGSFVFAVVVCGALTIAAYFDADRTFVDPLLFIVLLSELFALSYIASRRVEVHILLSRTLTYALLSILVAGLAALVYWQLDYPVEPVSIAATVSISLMASALFMGVSQRMASVIERVLFPAQARLERALEASRSELMALRRRLERVERLAITGELAASVAHEIKNPLAPIRGYAQLLAGKVESVMPEQRELFKKALTIIREESDRIDGRVVELLAVARADRQKLSSDDTLDLNRVVLEAIAVAEGEPSAPPIESKIDPALARVCGNADEIRGALINLIKNAVEAMNGQGGRIEVVTRRAGDRAIVEILDEGPGIDPGDVERVFRAFYTTKQGGTGLGLAIARTAVEAAGGSIELRAREDRRGALARVELEPKGDPT